MELIELKASNRKTTGNGPARVLRREGRMPAVLYGNKVENILLSLDAKELNMTLKNSSHTIFNIRLEDGSVKTVMLKELQRHPTTLAYLHADLCEIDMNKKIRTTIPIRTKGKAKGVEDGGILQIIRREIEVLCLPSAIPEAVEFDITDLDIGDSVHIDEIDLGNDVEIPFDTKFTLLTISSPTSDKEEETDLAEEEEETVEEEEETSEE